MTTLMASADPIPVAAPGGDDPLDAAPELAPYHDEPAQLPSGAPGKKGYLRLGFAVRGHRTELVDLDRRAPLLVQQALHWDESMPELACVFIISTSGGVLQGDRYAIEITAEPGARAHVTTQSATKIQEMDANYATLTQRITVGERSYLEYLPDPVIPYRHSRYVARTELCVAESATLLHAEVLLPGRKYHDGEVHTYDVYSASVRAFRPDGRELFTEKLVVEPATWSPGRAGAMGAFHVVGTVLLLTPPPVAERVLAQIPAIHRPADSEPLAAGASRLPGDAGLIYRVLGMESEPVRSAVRDFWRIARHEATGRSLTTHFRWR